MLTTTHTSFAGQADGRLDIYWVDTEGGAATLIVTPAGEAVLVDSGNPGRRDPDRIFQVATKTAGLRQIDHLITTHYHVDHFGGAATLSAALPIRQVHDNGAFEGQRERPDEAYSSFKTDKRSVISPGDEIALAQAKGDGAARLSLKCLAARQKFIAPTAEQLAAADNPRCAEHKPKPIDNSDNANSVVLLLSFGAFRFFDAGDLTWNIEKGLVCPKDLVGKVDVYQATHHGLDASNNPVLVETLQPAVAIVNNGPMKGGESGTFTTLKAIPGIEAIYQLHRNVRTGDEGNTQPELIANAEAECQGNFVHLSVDPTGKSYKVSIPATKHERTFQTR